MKRMIGMAAAALVVPALLAAQAADTSKLKDPSALKEQAPASYKAAFDTTAGKFVVDVHRDWAPKGADRFYNLVKNGFYDECRFFRVIPGFMVQWGINGDPEIQQHWRGAGANLTDDPVKQSNKKGFISFATGGPNSRTTQVFINYGDNSRLDASGFAPFGEVTSGMDVVEKINADSGEKPNQGSIQQNGNTYLKASFPKLDYVKKATIQK